MVVNLRFEWRHTDTSEPRVLEMNEISEENAYKLINWLTRVYPSDRFDWTIVAAQSGKKVGSGSQRLYFPEDGEL